MANLDTLTVRITGNASSLTSTLRSASKDVTGFADDVTSTTSNQTSKTFDTMGDKILNKTTSTLNNWGSKIKSGMSSALKAAGQAATMVAVQAVSSAIDKVMENVDAGIARSDTMANFSLVMSNMQIATEDSDAAIQTLSDRLTGLPTSLDTAASGVERLTAKNGDVQHSTDIWLALNDALLAGGQSSDIQANAMEQLMQAYSKGSIDLNEWQSLQIAMPAQLEQVAEAFGMTSDELYNALKSGEISIDEFMDKMVEMDTTSTDTFTSFQDQAFNATGGIQTAMDLIDTAITRGIQEVIDALGREEIVDFLGHIKDSIDDLAQKVVDFINDCADTGALETFWDILTKLWDIVGKLAEVIGTFIMKLFGIEDPANTAAGVLDAIDQALDWVSDGLDWVMQNLDWLVPLVETAAGMFMGLYTALELISIITTVGSGPLGIIITLVGMLVGALVGWIASDEDLQQNILDVFGVIGDFIGGVVDGIVSFFTEDIPAAWDKAVAMAQWLWDQICQIFQWIGDFIGGIADSIVWFFTEGIPGAWDYVCQCAQQFWDNICYIFQCIGDFIGGIVDGIVEFFTVTIPGAIDTVIQWFASIPENVMNFLGDLWDGICGVFSSIWEFISGIFEGIGTTISDAFWGFIDFIAGIGWDIWNAVSGAFQDAIDFILGLPEQALQWGSDIIQGIIDGITGMISGIGEAVGDIASTIAGFLGFSVPEVGPLSDFDTYMPDMMELMQEGIEEGVPQVEAAANEAANSIATSMSDAFNYMTNDANNAFNGVVDIITENLTNLNNESLDIVSSMSSGISSDFLHMDSTIEDDVTDMVETVKESLNDLSNYFEDSSIDVSDWQSELSGNFNHAALELRETMTSTLSDMETQSMDSLTRMSGEVGNELLSMSTSAAGIISDLQNSSDNSFKSLADNAVSSVQDMSNAVNTQLTGTESAMDDFEDYAEQWGENLGNDIAKGITNAKDSVKEAVTEIANEVDSVLGFSEPDTGPLSDFDESMPDMIDLMVEGILANEDKIREAAEIIGEMLATGLLASESAVMAQLTALFEALVDKSYDWGLSFAEGLAAGMQKGMSEVIAYISTLLASLKALSRVDVNLDGITNAVAYQLPEQSANLAAGETVINNYYSFDGITITGQDAEDLQAILERYEYLAKA